MAYESPWSRLTECVLRYADSGDDDTEFRKNQDVLRKAAINYGVWVVRNKDPNVRVYVVHKVRPFVPACQLSLWPARVGIRTQTVARLASTG